MTKKTRKAAMEFYLGFSFFFTGFFALSPSSAFESKSASSTNRWSSRYPSSAEGDGMQQPSSRQLLNVTAIAEQSVYLHPGKTAWKSSKFEWRRGNQILPANHRQSIFDNGTLLIKNVDQALDAGLYSGPTVEYQLDIIQPPRIEPLAFPSDLSPLARVRVSCVVSKGDPPITIEWYKDNQRLTTASAALLDISLTNIDEFASFLSIPSLNVRHSGNYTCMARNRAAQDAKTAKLVVNVPVHWVHEPSSKAFALQNANLNMTCQANGNPKPVIEWKKALPGLPLGNYTPVANDRSHLFENGTLIMRDVQRSDEGHYLCQASNGIGPVISKVVHLTVKAPAYFRQEQETVAVTLGSGAALECHAYGELPITVHWLYRGKALKEGTYDRLSFDVQSLENSAKSTVRISRSQRADSGVYSCNATNEFGSKTRKVEFLVQEVAEKPTGVNVAAINSRMAQLEWSAGYDGNSPVINFILEWKRQTDLWTHDGMKREHAPGNSTKYTLNNLHPATRYDLRVRAENALGQSEPSLVVQIVTDEERPSGVPQDVRLTSPTFTTINLTWKPPAPETHNGAIQGYVIEYKAENSSENFVYKKIQSDGKREESVTLRDLRKYTPYVVVIQAYNTIGSGPKSDPTTIWTQEDVPSDAPRLVAAIPESPQRISMTWEQLPHDSVNGALMGYKVLYKPLDDWTSQSNVKIIQDTSCVLDDLKKFTNYTIQVLAFTKEGEGPASVALFAKTLPDVPSHPAEIKAWSTSATSILVTWNEPKEKNGIIKNYNVYMRSLSGRKDKKRIVYPDDVLNKFEFAGLIMDTQYEVWVTAETEVGESGSSFPVKVTPTSTGPARIATFSTTVSVPTGQSAVLPCMGVGYPDPATAEWWQGSRTVKGADGNREILRNGSMRIVRSQPSDSGVFACRVRNLYGEDSVEVTLIVQRPPMSPNLTVMSTTENTVVVSWKVLYDGGSTVKGYTLYYKSIEDQWKSIRLPANFQTYTLKNLLCGHSYSAYITAYNDVGTSEASASVTARIPGQVPVSSDLQSLIFPNTTSVIVFLSAWKDGGCPIKTFGIQYQAFHEKEWVRYGDQIPGNAESITIPDLEPQNAYRMKLRAVNDAGVAEREYVFGTLTENGDAMLPEVIMRKEQSVRPFHEDPPKISAAVGGTIFALLLIAAVALLVKRRRSHKYPSNDRDLTNNRRLISHHLDYLTPRKSASFQTPWKTINEFSDPNHRTPISLGGTPQQWRPPICNDDFMISPPPYGSPKRLNTTIRTNNISLHEIDTHYQTPRSARVIKRDDSTPDSGFSGSNLKHTDGEGTFQRQSVPRTSNGSVTSDSDNLQRLNLNLHKNRPKPAPRRRPPTRPRHMGTASLARTRSGPPAGSSSSPSSTEDVPHSSHTARFVRKHQPHIHFPSPPHSDDDGRRPVRLTHQETFDMHRYSCELRPMDQYTFLEDGRQLLQPTTTV